MLFVVDRKDLDYQTMREYDNFEPNCANSNTSAQILRKQMKDDQATIIITTIQKLSNLLKPKIFDNDEQLRDIVTNYIISHFTEKTKQNKFNSILAVDGVKTAIKYYHEFKKQLQEPGTPRLRIATIFTYSANEEEEDEWGFSEGENPENTEGLDLQSRDALQKAINDYNQMFGTTYSTEGDSFQNYYKDVSQKMKRKELDILIVVGMFLTGFDAKTLNTLWVDKNLKMHGLLQAYSRTNRILNAVKNCGNIICWMPSYAFISPYVFDVKCRCNQSLQAS
ncbi:MAG: DEAD/DEAH box helicase family protein [Prevotella sp.]|nr:DEAD/DEAH box helicase family protein [Prevotella sp.]